MDKLKRKGWGRMRWAILGVAVSLLWVGSAQAISITATIVPPTPSTPTIGSSIFLDVSVSGLTLGGAPSITAFDIDIAFDAAVVDFVGITFSSLAGLVSCTPATFDASCEAFEASSLPSPASPANFAAASFAAPATINASQAASGTVAVLEFVAVGAGTTLFSFASVNLAGTIAGTTEGTLSATTTGTSQTVAVPEPVTSLLVLLGLAALGARSRAAGR